MGELVLSFESTSCIEAPSKAPISMNQTMLDLINYNLRHSPTGKLLGDQTYKLTAQDLEVLDRFSRRTILTLGTDVTKWILQAETPRLACLVSQVIITCFVSSLSCTWSGRARILVLMSRGFGAISIYCFLPQPQIWDTYDALKFGPNFYPSLSLILHSNLKLSLPVSEADKSQHPFLMHAVLAFTYSHDRLLKPVPEKAGAAELFHNYKGAALFNYRLNGDVTSSERDAIVSHKSSHNLYLYNLIIGRA